LGSGVLAATNHGFSREKTDIWPIGYQPIYTLYTPQALFVTKKVKIYL